MNRTRRWLFPVVGLLIMVVARSGAAPAALAGTSAPMKCAANQDRVWVYESLGSFDVAAKLKCGETVEIIGRVKGFVKIHSASGAEGWVPDSTFPNLSPLEDENNKPPAIAASLAQAWARAHARAAASAPAPAAAIVQPSAAPVSVVSASAPAVVPVASTVSAQPAVAATPAHAPAVIASKSPAVRAMPSAPVEIVLTTAPEVRSAANPTSAGPATVASVAASNAQPTSTSSAAPSPMKKTSTSAANSSAPPAGTSASTHSAPSTASTVNSASKAPAAVSSAAKAGSNKSSAAQPPAAGSTHSNPAPAPAAPPAVPSNSKATENTASLQTSRPVASIHPVAAIESEDFPDAQPESESADPACQIFFSAYGLTPDQFRWLAQNRKKKFANVCPAPDTSSVDFVIIFTHDVDFYGNTLPSPVHTDKSGFSDFSPVTMLDTTVTPLSQAEKARREYVYVFKMRRGAFDPARFSPRRRYQFTKAESNSLTSSHASSRTVEDAFRYMEEQGPTR